MLNMEDNKGLSNLMRNSSTDVVLKYIRNKNINAETFAEVDNRFSSPLGLAIKYGRLLVMNELISRGFDPNSSCTFDYHETLPPFHLACKYNRLDIILSLHHDHGIKIDSVDDSGVTALVYTVSNTSEKTLDVVKTLVEAGASVNTSCRDGRTLLSMAVARQNIDVCRYLISKGADVDARNKDVRGNTCLMFALRCRADIGMMRLLVESGADVNASDSESKSSLIYAIGCNAGIDVIRLLLDCGADVNQLHEENTSPLGSVFHGNDDLRMDKPIEEIVEKLFKYGSGKLVDNNPVSPLIYALRNKANIEVIKLLVKAEADVNTLDNNRASPLMLALVEGVNFELYRLLVEAGADINALDKDKKGPLHYVLENYGPHTVNIVAHLIDSGTDVNALDINNTSPLMYALEYESEVNDRAVRLLLESGAKVNAVDKHQQSPLVYAFRNSRHDGVAVGTIQVLLDSGADVNIHDDNGDSPLMHALFRKASAEIMLLLLECGVDICARNRKNVSLLSFICEVFDEFQHDGEIINMFVEYAGDVKGHFTTVPYTTRIHDAFDMIRTLCSKGADIEAKNKTGNSVLHQVMKRNVPCCCAKCFNLVHFLIVELNLSLWALNSDNQTPFRCALTDFKQKEAGKILKLCVQAGYTPDSEEMAVVRQIEEKLSVDIRRSDVTSLQDICCFSVRRALGRRLPAAVNSLPIADKLKQRVKLTHVEKMIETPENTVDDDDYDDDDDYYDYAHDHNLYF